MDNDTAALALAWKAHQEGKVAEAVRLARGVVDTAPGNAAAWCLLGIAQRTMGAFADAEASQRAALLLRPDYADAWNNLGVALLMQRKLDEAVAAFRQVLRLRPDHAYAFCNLGTALAQQNRWAEAAECCRQALRLRPDYPDAHSNLGTALAALRQPLEAITHLREACRLRPDLPETHYLLGYLLAEQGRFAEAEAGYREALRLRPDHAEARAGLDKVQAALRHAASEAGDREALLPPPGSPDGGRNLPNTPAINCTFREDIRLVVWDLDETFWRGTLTEGEVAWVDEHAHIVKTLAARGIVSSICSRNDFDPAMAVLKSRGLDSYFVFPSIDWSAKGNRIKAIVEGAQLRAETVLFLDDNHLSRAEVSETVPGINVADESFIPHLLSHPQLAGKDDRDLTRLAQYKSLERRKRDAASAGDNADDFLRHSGIKVFIDYNLEGNVDRCIELINRTNQLNFTKQRLPADPLPAREAFLKLIREPRIQGGLIHCHDKYGDHGYVGLYVILEGRVLKHFLFSCRVLGMGLEQWLYRRLGNPYLEIVGPVLSDPKQDGRTIDWIELLADRRAAPGPEEAPPRPKKIAHFYVLGGCVMENIGHYLQVFSDKVVYEGNARRNGIDVRRTHTCFLVYRDWLANPQFLAAAAQLGCVREDFENRIFQADDRSAVVLSFWYDQICTLYQHRELPIELPFQIDGLPWDADVTAFRFEDLPAEFKAEKSARCVFQSLKDHFTFKGYIEPCSYKNRLAEILGRIHPEAPIFLLDVPSQDEIKWRERQIQPDMLGPIQQVHRELAAERKHLHVIDPLECVRDPSERLDWWHFDRKVYYRIFQRIMALISE